MAQNWPAAPERAHVFSEGTRHVCEDSSCASTTLEKRAISSMLAFNRILFKLGRWRCLDLVLSPEHATLLCSG